MRRNRFGSSFGQVKRITLVPKVLLVSRVLPFFCRFLHALGPLTAEYRMGSLTFSRQINSRPRTLEGQLSAREAKRSYRPNNPEGRTIKRSPQRLVTITRCNHDYDCKRTTTTSSNREKDQEEPWPAAAAAAMTTGWTFAGGCP